MWEQLLSSVPNYNILSVNVCHILKRSEQNGLVPPNLEKPAFERPAGFTDNQDYFINNLYLIYFLFCFVLFFIVLSLLAAFNPLSRPAAGQRSVWSHQGHSSVGAEQGAHHGHLP